MVERTGYSYSTEKGFTLIELSIVLVIIGLIVGAILVGRDMIKAAELRSTISQVEKYQAAVNTFRLKYAALPGDILSAQAVAFGFFSETMFAGLPGHQDGNGLIEGGFAGSTSAVGETLSFWVHLSQANLVDGQFGQATNAVLQPNGGSVTATVTVPSQSLPPSKLTPTQYFIVYAYQGFNYFALMPITTISPGGSYPSLNSVGLTPIQAYNMDVKLDDGMPNTGNVVARSGPGMVFFLDTIPTVGFTSLNNFCTIGTVSATDTYNRVLSTGGNDGSCSLRFRFN